MLEPKLEWINLYNFNVVKEYDKLHEFSMHTNL